MSLFNSLAFLPSLFAQATEPGQPPAAPSMFWTNSGIILALLVISFLLGGYLARVLRMADYGWKISVILLATLASAVVVVRGWPPKLGIDLGGGAILVYQVDPNIRSGGLDKDTMNTLISSISKRVNPGGQKEIAVRQLGDDMVQITMPAVSGGGTEEERKQKEAESEAVKNIIQRQGSMIFRILANRFDNSSLIKTAKELPDNEKVVMTTGSDGTRVEEAHWYPVREKEVGGIVGDPEIGTRPVADPDHPEKKKLEALVLTGVNDHWEVTGDYLTNAKKQIDQKEGGPCVGFSFNTEGAHRFGRLTGEHTPKEGGVSYRLAIVLDNEIQSAPTIRSMISESGEITGHFTDEEVDELVRILNAGSLPAALIKKPVRDMITGPTLGADTIQKSALAMIISSILVPLFMFWYYRFAGIVANLALALNMLILVALMILFKAPFTLPAIAGLALTVGMAVDNNVLIYERLREELAHGAALRMAIRNAFHRAGVVIIDANITHLIAASVLFYKGTEQVRGFAVTFWLGAVLSIWATMFVARVMFEIAERRRWVTQIKMKHIIGHTQIDFMGWFRACLTFSIVITVLGLLVAFYRGKGLFDVDFTGGVSVEAVFEKPQNIAEIRKVVDTAHEPGDPEKKLLPDGTVTNVQRQNEPENQRFIIDTSNDNRDNVRENVQALFAGQLVTIKMDLVSVSTSNKPAAAGPVEKPLLEAKPGAKPPEKAASKPEKEPAVAPPKPVVKPEDKAAPKSPEKPAGKPAAPPVDKTGAKPAEKPAAAPADKPVGKPAEKPVEKPAETDGKQSRDDLPSDSLVAMAGSDVLLIAQAEKVGTKPEAKADAKPEGKPDTKPESKPETKPETKADAKPETKPATRPETKADAKPVAKPETKPQTKPESRPEAKPEAKPETKPQARSSEAVQAELKFSSETATLKDGQLQKQPQEVRFSQTTLKGLVEKALEANRLSSSEINVELTNPKATDYNTQAFDQWTLRLAPMSNSQVEFTPAKAQAVLASLRQQIEKEPYFPGIDSIGGAVARDTRYYAVVALVISWTLIILYLWVRFQGVAFGLAAVIALIHDVLVMLGAIAFSVYVPAWLGYVTMIEPFKINLPIVAAFMTIIGYSVNDTIVVFDRIREIRGKAPSITRQIVNDATNQTLSRTLLTSFTVLLVVMILYLAGGQAVHGFAFALIIGVMTGTYSSIYVAAPILLWLGHPKEMKQGAAGKNLESTR